jgi:TIR domain
MGPAQGLDRGQSRGAPPPRAHPRSLAPVGGARSGHNAAPPAGSGAGGGRKLLADHGDVLIDEVQPYIAASLAADEERQRQATNFLERSGIKRIGDKLMKAKQEYRILNNEMEELNTKRAELEKKLQAARVKIDESIPFIFISYAREDEDSARRIYNKLKREGLRVWMDKKDLLPGQNWDLEIRKAMHRSDFIILCLSRKSVSKRGYIQKEMKIAMDIFMELPRGSVFLIPVLINQCEVPDEMSMYQYIDLGRDDAMQMIFRSIAEEVGRRRGEAPTNAEAAG